MTVIEQLQAARGLIERGWCQGEFAKTADGRAIAPSSDFAHSWCVMGACVRAKISSVESNYLRFIYAALPDNYHTVAAFNDAPGRTQAEILKLFDDAIELAKAGEA